MKHANRCAINLPHCEVKSPELGAGSCAAPSKRASNLIVFGTGLDVEALTLAARNVGARCLRSYWSGSTLVREYRA